jgi:hypothetical protein
MSVAVADQALSAVQQGTGGVHLFLKAAADPTAHPFWTSEHNEAGAWSLRDAARLAALHTGLRDFKECFRGSLERGNYAQ